MYRHTECGKRGMYIGFVPLIDIHNIHNKIGGRLLSRNIRSGLANDTPPNRKIREALSDIVLRGKTSPDVFTFNHNGVTMAAEKLEIQDGQAVITVPRVLNGAQTLKCCKKFIEDNENSITKERKSILDSITVVAKIVIDDPTSEFVSQVTISNNQQNPVEPWHLHANDKIQCDLQDRFREQLGIFYSRQENAFKNMTGEELEELDLADGKDIQIKPLAQTFLAVQGEIDRMSRLREVFEQQKVYVACFKESYLRCNTRKIILVYKIGLMLNPIMRRLEDNSSQLLGGCIRSGRNLVWALLAQGVLNDRKNLDDMIDSYGEDLRKSNEYKEYLVRLVTSKVYAIITKVISSDNGYKEKIKSEKYSFFRNKELFRRCMEVADEKYGWEKQTF